MASLRKHPSWTRTRSLLLISNPQLCNRSSSLASSPSPQPSTPPLGFRCFSSSLSQITRNLISTNSRVFCSRSLDLDDAQGPAAIDYRSVLQEDEFHRLADETIQDLQENFEEYGDCIQIDGLDIDYGNQVLTLKLGSLGTYVLNKQTPNRQIWLSSPVSGPSRFDWDQTSQAWVYRRTKAKLLQLLENELEQLCGRYHDDEAAGFSLLQFYLLKAVYPSTVLPTESCVPLAWFVEECKTNAIVPSISSALTYELPAYFRANSIVRTGYSKTC